MKTEWVQKKLGELGSVNPNNREPIPDHFIYIDLESVVSGQLLAEKLISKKEAPSRAQRIVYFNDVLYQTVRPYQNNNYIHKKRGDYIASTGYALIRCYEDYDPDFVYYLLHTQHFESVVLGLCTGTSYPAIAPNSLKRIEVAVPSTLPAQRHIAAILSSADKVIATTQKVIAKYKQMKQGMMEDLLKPKEGWKKVKLGECCITELGKTLDEGRNTGEYRPYLCALNVLWGKIDITTIKQMRIEDDELNRYAVKKGDLLVCEGGEIGRCAIWDYDDIIYYQNALHRVRFFNGYDSMYFMYLLCYYNDLNLLEQHGKGLTIKHLNQTSFRSIPVSVPDLPEQRRVAKILLGIDRKIETEEKVLEKYALIKKGLMEKLLQKQ